MPRMNKLSLGCAVISKEEHDRIIERIKRKDPSRTRPRSSAFTDGYPVACGQRVRTRVLEDAGTPSSTPHLAASPLALCCCKPGADEACKKPEPPKTTIWDVYKIAEKAVWLGAVEAPDKQSAIEKAAVEFKVVAWRLYAMGLR
jgi:hypothetical protein